MLSSSGFIHIFVSSSLSSLVSSLPLFDFPCFLNELRKMCAIFLVVPTVPFGKCEIVFVCDLSPSFVIVCIRGLFPFGN